MAITLLLTTIFTTNARAQSSEIVIYADPISFGWFKELDEAQMNGYTSAIGQALLNADNGVAVRWSKHGAWGFSEVIYTEPTYNGYCRTLYTEVNAFEQQKSGVHRYCYRGNDDTWILMKKR